MVFRKIYFKLNDQATFLERISIHRHALPHYALHISVFDDLPCKEKKVNKMIFLTKLTTTITGPAIDYLIRALSVRIVKRLTQHIVRSDFRVATNGSPPYWWQGCQSVICIHDWFQMSCHFSPRPAVPNLFGTVPPLSDDYPLYAHHPYKLIKK